MPSSWTQNPHHAVFSTKHRLPVISVELQERLYPFVGGILKDLRCVPIAINGTEDHLHLVTRFPSDLAPADMLRHVKKRSSEWVRDSGVDFEWQQGYGGFTVSKSALDDVVAYVRNQREHHKRFGSLEEFKELLLRNEIEFHEDYLA